MGDMIRQMAFAIADGQASLDASSIDTAEMMGGLTTVYDENGAVTFDDSRVFFGYEYMTLPDALSYAAVDGALSGTLDLEESVDLTAFVEDAISALYPGRAFADLTEEERRSKIRVPVRLSMMELGFAPTFYQFVDTIIEVKIAIKITRTHEYGYGRSTTSGTRASRRGRDGFLGLFGDSTSKSSVTTSQVDASYSSKYSYSAEGASILRTKIAPVPTPPILEDRIRSFMETEEEARRLEIEAERRLLLPDTDPDA
ncbi:hypothetical protein CFK38_04145 [Brachybacterium vulturis]|uniref:Uncharacterized protein n=2 Tax=Brachybacterium vulturis TaxID=2017484 RepID=A0A291GSJ0_9MICO|nr:hypothetical protein CFK38_04145 [Brachybacterium vulturis]